MSKKSDQQNGICREAELKKESMISVLEEFNRYRRGVGEYMWNENPEKNKQLSISPKVIGEAIDYAVKYMKEH